MELDNNKKRILITFFVLTIFVSFLGPIIDPDFPFHLKTGEYIYVHKEIPKDDPFSFYGEGSITEREQFTLSQYWFAQVIFYKLYSVAGPPGIILLRAIIFSVFVFLIWFILRKRGFYSSLIIATLVTIMLQASKLDRPQYFSFFFCLILILLFEKFREKPESETPLYFIPLLMLLWANMHAGFIFGVVIILIYSLSETIKFFVNKPSLIGQPLHKKALLLFLLVALLAIFFSYMNPITNNQLVTTIDSHTDANWLYKQNREYMSPIEEMGAYYAAGISTVIFFVLFGFVSMVIILNIIRGKSADLTILVLLIFSSVAAFTAVRYIPFFLAIAFPLIRDYKFQLNKIFFKRLRESIITYATFLVLLGLLISFGLRDRQIMFQIGKPIVYPKGAANFLLENRMDARMFNQHNRGSYLIWQLYPYYQVFNDSRFISLEAVIDTDVINFTLDDYNHPNAVGYARALSAIVPEELGRLELSAVGFVNETINTKLPLWKKLLNEYKIDIIVHEACSDYNKELFPLILRLLRDDDWVLVYLDGTIMIFVRNEKRYSTIIEKFKKPKKLIYDQIIFETAPFVTEKVPISTPYSSLAFAFMMKGKNDEARKMINAALELNNKDIVAHFCSAYLALKQNYSNNTN